MKKLTCVGIFGLLAMVTAPTAKAATWEHVSMVKGPHVMADPLNIWTPAEVTEALDVAPEHLRFYVGRHFADDKTIIVSEMISSTCGMQTCPVKVVLQTKDGKSRVLIDNEQVCASSEFFAIKSDLSAFKACDQVYPLKSR